MVLGGGVATLDDGVMALAGAVADCGRVVQSHRQVVEKCTKTPQKC